MQLIVSMIAHLHDEVGDDADPAAAWRALCSEGIAYAQSKGCHPRIVNGLIGLI